MKIQLFVNGIKNSITSTGFRIRKASVEGYVLADRTAKVYKQNNIKKYYNATKSIAAKITKNTTADELPYLAGALGMLIPLPFASPILMGVGLVAKYIAKGIDLLRHRF